MEQFNNSKKFQEIINSLNNNKFKDALDEIKKLSSELPNNLMIDKLLATIYFKKMDWKKSIKYHYKILINEKDKYKIFTNIGFAYFKLGEIQKSIDAYKKSIEDNPNFEIAYSNLAISYIELGFYEKACSNFLKLLKINKNNLFAQKYLIYLLNFIEPENIKDHPLLEINSKIKSVVNNLNVV